jgi:hypothetical protein
MLLAAEATAPRNAHGSVALIAKKLRRGQQLLSVRIGVNSFAILDS